MKFNYLVSSLLVGALGMVACSSTPAVHELSNDTDPAAALSKLDNEIQEARTKQVDELAPKNFDAAVTARDQARDDRAKNKDQKVILHDISVAEAYLAKANESTAVSDQVLTGAVHARMMAVKAEAPKYYPKEFAAADDKLKSLTREVEGGKTDGAEKAKGNLEAKYSELELNSIREANIGAAKKDVQEAINEGAKKWAPQTLAWAQKKIDDADHVITSDRHNMEAVGTASASASRAGTRVLKLVRQAKLTASMTPEQLAKQLEQDRIDAQAAAQESEEDRIAKERELAHSEAVIDRKDEKIAALAATNEQLSSKQKLENEYESARKLFTADEAEVSKQGDKLLLRLKGMSFPKDQATIATANYSLLAKLQKAIKETDANSVVIEGHTDSTGSKAINEKLSQARADSVKQYLVANNAVKDDEVTTKGFGDSKPIATNKTAKGRAENRRIEVIISNSDSGKAPASDDNQN